MLNSLGFFSSVTINIMLYFTVLLFIYFFFATYFLLFLHYLFISYLLIYFYLLQHLDVRDRNHARKENVYKKCSISFVSCCFSFDVISSAFFLLQFDA